MEQIPYYGSWKDLLMCCVGTEFEEPALVLMAGQLKQDLKADRPSLCAKYAPSEGGAFDRKYGLADKLARHLHVSPMNYRKTYLVPLRKRLNIVEQAMCAKQWETINYETVPSIAGKNYKKAFKRHDEIRYSEYLQSVTKGDKKMNTGVLMPYQMVAPYLQSSSLDQTIEAQWVSFLKDRRERWPTSFDILPLIDVSGSMFNGTTPQAVEVAISLGLIVASLNSSVFHNKFITFHDEPQLLSIPESSLYEQVNYIKKTPWGGSTSFLKAFTLILNHVKGPSESIPKILLVLSDMQFNQADNKTNWEVIEQMYQEAGHERPFMIFWNLKGTTIDYPIPDASMPNCALLSGYNDNILTAILNGTIPSPLELVYKTLRSERYERIVM